MQNNRFSDGGDSDSLKHNEQINKYPGFFFWDKNTDIQWLRDFLSKTSITSASICRISHSPGEDWKTLAESSSPIILCHSSTTDTEWTCLEEFLTHCKALPGKRVIVIITDVKDSGSEKSIQEEWGKWKFPDFELITLTCQEIDFMSTYISQDLSPERKMARKIHILKNILQTTAGRDNVIVVMDDLEESTDEVKDQILKEQHSIKKWARDLFIFCQEEKKMDPHIIPSMEEKMKHLEAMITGSTEQCVASSTRQRTPAFPDSSRQNVPASASLTGQRPFASNVFTAPRSFFLNNSSTSQAQSMESGATGNDDIVTTDGASNKDKTPEASFKGNMDKIRKIMESTRPIQFLIRKPHTVGIFSRSSESDYEWLIKQLKSEPFHYIVSTANPRYISNNGMQKFRDDVSGCTFGILYHTRNRGRINIVDVTSSLYDEEMNYMSQHLGKEKVIVVVDDLEDASDGEKRGILESQPSIGKLATDIFLFNANDKKK